LTISSICHKFVGIKYSVSFFTPIIYNLNSQTLFDETKKYEVSGHFFFNPGDKLSEIIEDVPDLPGVYYIYRLANDCVDLVYIGSSAKKIENGKVKIQSLRERFNNLESDRNHQVFFDKMIPKEKIVALDIYWFATMDGKHKDAPDTIFIKLAKRYNSIYGEIPPWNWLFKG
jgi:hypothetical protein